MHNIIITLFELISNFRFLQIIYHLGLLFIGISLSCIYIPYSQLPSTNLLIILIITIISSWISTVFFNDVSDIEIDKISNPNRPLPKGIITKQQSLAIGFILLIFSLLLSNFISNSTLIFIIGYHILSWIYNMKPFRLKRVPLLATFIAACASIFIILIGFLSNSNDFENFKYLPIYLLLSMLIGYTLSLPIKDLKDYDGDKYDNIKTIPVIFGINKSRVIIGLNLLFSFILSAILLDFFSLIIPASFTGLLSLLILISKRKSDYIVKIPKLLSTIFIITFIYAIITTLIIFKI